MGTIYSFCCLQTNNEKIDSKILDSYNQLNKNRNSTDHGSDHGDGSQF